ncbi:unnamed protein product [Caenorhabditis sp. 36 PRJEB53466]|nr:unnamed protein product [Caenorhabditis sp. 36 PRJEB53466]
MAVSLDEQNVHSEIATAVAGPYSETELKSAANSTLRSRSVATTRTARSSASAPAAAAAQGPSYDKMISAFATVAFSYLLLGISLYVEATVSLFHVGYFSYRNPAVSKDLIKTAFHLLKTSYDNKLLTISEIYETTNHSIIKPMARQNKQHFLEENQRTAQLQTMKISSATR